MTSSKNIGRKLAGHARSGVTEQVYTHRRFEYLQTEINKI